LGDRRLRAFARMPLAVGQALPLMMRARMGNVPNLGSTLQSIRRGQRTEIDYLNGAIVREAGIAGVGAPVNALMVELVHEVEERGSSLPPADVIARFRRLH
jgi:2-dehydropantoate 2-reductase